MARITHGDRVLEFLRAGNVINGAIARDDFGIMELPSVIYGLRHKGHNIKTTMRESLNRWGDKVEYAEYSLVPVVAGQAEMFAPRQQEW